MAKNEANEVGAFDGEDGEKSLYFAFVVRILIIFESPSKLKELTVGKTLILILL